MSSIREYRDKNNKLISFYIRVHRGKNVKPYITTFKVNPEWTYKRALKEVKQYAIIFERECKEGKISTSSSTLSEYMNYVIELKFERGQIKKRTYTLNKSIANRISKELGHIKLKDLTVKDLNRYYSKLSESLSAKTISEYHHLISSTLKQAVKEGQLVYSIADRAEVPKQKKPEVKYFQREDIIKILSAANEEDLMHKTLINLFVYTGCRRGELLGLKWEDIDFNTHTIQIKRTILYTKEFGLFEDTPKTVKSARRIQIPEHLINILKEYKTNSKSKIWVFCNTSGQPLHPDSINTYLNRFAKKHDLPHINPHAFRHTMASLLYYEGMDSVSISARLGHSKVSTTADIYSHVVNNYDTKNTEILTKIFEISDKVVK